MALGDSLRLKIDSIEKVGEDLAERLRAADRDARLDCVRHINRLCARYEGDGPPVARQEVVAMLVDLWGAVMDGEGSFEEQPRGDAAEPERTSALG